jgi:large-conductance mechanosensitive channel
VIGNAFPLIVTFLIKIFIISVIGAACGSLSLENRMNCNDSGLDKASFY